MSKIDYNAIQETIDLDMSDTEYIYEISDKMVSECCDKLDKYVGYVQSLLNNSNYTLTDAELDDIVVTIPTLMYFASTQQERIGIRYDIAKTKRNQMYNEVYTKSPGTAGVKKAAAEKSVFNEDVVSIIYSRSYNIIKSKLDIATEILQSAKKVVSRRISDLELSKSVPNKNNL